MKAPHGWEWRKETIRDGERAQVYSCDHCGVFRISWWTGTGARFDGWRDRYQQNRYRLKGETKDRFEFACKEDRIPKDETLPAETAGELSLK